MIATIGAILVAALALAGAIANFVYTIRTAGTSGKTVEAAQADLNAVIDLLQQLMPKEIAALKARRGK